MIIKKTHFNVFININNLNIINKNHQINKQNRE